MAISKKLVRNFLVVWDKDPAFDKDSPAWAEEWKQYLATRDPSKLPVKDGMKPALFHCKPLSMGGFNRMLGEMTQLGQCIEAVRYGLEKVEGVEVDGKPLVIDTNSHEADGRDKRLKTDIMEMLFDPGLFGAIGLAVIEESQLDPTRARG